MDFIIVQYFAFQAQSRLYIDNHFHYDKNNNFLIYKSANSHRQFALVGYNYFNIRKEERDQQIFNIIQSEEENTKGIIVIGNNLNDKIYPYSILAGKFYPQLFV